MRSVAFVLVIPLLACSATVSQIEPPPPDGATDGGGGDAPSTMLPVGFQLASPTIDVNPGVEVTYCYYFHTSNTRDLMIQSWASHMTAGVHDAIVFLTPTDQQTAGTMSTTDCGITNSASGPGWAYAAQTANVAQSTDGESQMPANDGDGNPIGQVIKAGQSGFLQMHYINTTTAVIHPHVEVVAYAYPGDVQVTPAALFVTFNLKIQLDPGSPASPTTGTVNGTCPVPLDDAGQPLKFVTMTTHTHKQGVHTSVKDGTTMVFDSTSWDQPGAASWPKSPFFTFKTGTLTYQCDYQNPNNYTIRTGDNAATDEMCMAIGYFFPAPSGAGHFCLNSAMVF